jgi:hypothetical protein
MGEYLCPINAPPVKSVVREFVVTRPRKLLCQKVIDARALHYLGKLRGIAEGVWKEKDLDIGIKFLLCEELSVEQLSDHRLA